MKLSNQQVSALADRIYEQVKKEVDVYNKNLASDDKFKVWKKNNKELVSIITNAIEYCKLWEKKGDPSYYVNNIARLNVEENLESEFKGALETKSYPNTNSIKSDIILETIECENLESIITKLVDKYTK